MRRWITAGLCTAAAVMALTGCSVKKPASETGIQSDSNLETSTAAGTQGNASASSVTLGKYKGIPVTVKKAVVTDADLEQQITQILNSKPQYTEVNRAAKEGDTVNIDYTGLLDGKAFDGGTAKGYDLELGSHTFIAGFEEGLIGVKKGDHKDLKLTFPKDYTNKDLAGKAVVFKVTVNSVKEKTVPELNDAFVAKEYPEQGTVAEFRKTLKSQMLDAQQRQIDNQKDSDIINAIIDDSKVVVSDADVEKEYETQLNNYTNQAKQYGTDLSGMAQMYGTDEDGLKKQIKQMAAEITKQDLVLKAIAKKEKITVNDADREALAKLNGANSAADLVKTYGQEMVDDVALYQKVMKFLAENAAVTVLDSTEAPEAADTAGSKTAAPETAAASTAAPETAAASTAAPSTAASNTAAPETVKAQ